MMGLFGKSRSPKEQVQEWTSSIRKEGFKLDRQIQSIKREEEKVKRSIKDAAKKGGLDACKILARQLVDSRKACQRIQTTKARLQSVEYSMKEQLAMLRISKSLQVSTDVMHQMSALVKIPEVAAVCREMSKEMMKMGLIEEMMEDTMEMIDDDDELEEDIQKEVDKILNELTAGPIARAPAARQDTLPDREPESEGATAAMEEDMTDMRARLEALRS